MGNRTRRTGRGQGNSQQRPRQQQPSPRQQRPIQNPNLRAPRPEWQQGPHDQLDSTASTIDVGFEDEGGVTVQPAIYYEDVGGSGWGNSDNQSCLPASSQEQGGGGLLQTLMNGADSMLEGIGVDLFQGAEPQQECSPFEPGILV